MTKTLTTGAKDRFELTVRCEFLLRVEGNTMNSNQRDVPLLFYLLVYMTFLS